MGHHREAPLPALTRATPQPRLQWMPQSPQDRASIQDAPTVLVFYYFLAWSLIFELAYPTTGTTDQMRTSAKPITVVLHKTVAIRPKATSVIGKYFRVRSTMPCAIFDITLTNFISDATALKWGPPIVASRRPQRERLTLRLVAEPGSDDPNLRIIRRLFGSAEYRQATWLRTFSAQAPRKQI